MWGRWRERGSGAASGILWSMATVLLAVAVVAAPTSQASAARAMNPPSGTATIAMPPAGPDFTAVAFPTAQAGWVVGPGFIWHTADGGRQWVVQYHGTAQLEGAQAVDVEDAYAWGPHSLLATHNGGQSWHTVYQTGGTVESLSWTGADTGFAVISGVLQRTVDGGATWAELPTPTPFSTVRFVSAHVGWAVAARTGAVWRTVDGGLRWTRSFAPEVGPNQQAPGAVTAVLAAGSPESVWVLYVGGSGMSQTSYAVYHTADGVHWRAVIAAPTAGGGPAPGNPTGAPAGPEVPGGIGSSPGPLVATGPHSAVVLGECRACALGLSDLVHSANNGLSWSKPVVVPLAEGLPTFADLAFPTPATGWLAIPGFDGGSTILVTHDGGGRWTPVWPPSPVPWLGVSFVNTQRGYGLGEPGNPGAVLTTANGGRSWNLMAQLPGQEADPAALGTGTAIVFTSSLDGLAVGPSGRLYRTVDSGHRWEPVPAPAIPNASINLVDGVGCVGNADLPGPVLWTTNDGRSWHDTANGRLFACLDAHLPSWVRSALPTAWTASGPYGPGLRAVGGNAAVAWAEGPNNDWIVLVDRGRRQGHLKLGGQFFFALDAVSYATASDAWILIPGSLYRSTDGGLQWERLPG
jgi:photosystem II stability/assembly factor-like uncharacterized protein